MLQKFNKRNRRLNWGHMSTVFYRSDNICCYSLGLFPRKFRDLKPRYRIVGFIIENGTNLNPSEGDIKDIPGGLYQFGAVSGEYHCLTPKKIAGILQQRSSMK